MANFHLNKYKLPNFFATPQQKWADIDFLTPDPYPKKCLHIHTQPLSENFWN